MIHKVEITETLSRVVEVDAKSREDAEIKVQEWYYTGRVVLNAEDLEEQPEKREIKYREMER